MKINYVSIKFVLAMILASVLATVIVMAGAYTFAGFGKLIYNSVAVLASSSIPTVVGINIGM